MSLLRAEALDVEIGAVRVCNGFELTLAEAQCWGVLGANGAGKTTLLHTLAGLRAPAAGSVQVAGTDLQVWRRKALARVLGVLFQDSQDVFPASVFETALAGRYPHLAPWAVESEHDIRITHTALQEVALEHMCSRGVDTLSGGERRRLALATLFVQRPRIWLLDEPTNHLDLHQQIRLLELVRDRACGAGGGVIMTLHDVNLLERFCTHAMLLVGDGEIVHGTVNEVVNLENLERLYRRPIACLTDTDGRRYFHAR